MFQFDVVALNQVRLLNGVPMRVWFNNFERKHAQWLVAPNGVMKLVPVAEIAALPIALMEVPGAFPAVPN